jgi:hypothetical protein
MKQILMPVHLKLVGNSSAVISIKNMKPKCVENLQTK